MENVITSACKITQWIIDPFFVNYSTNQMQTINNFLMVIHNAETFTNISYNNTNKI